MGWAYSKRITEWTWTSRRFPEVWYNMNIAVFSHYFSPEIGAPSSRIHDMAKQWLELKHDVQVVTCFPNHPTGKVYPGYERCRYMLEMLDGIKVHRHWTYITPNKGFTKKALGHLSYWAASAWLSEARLSKPDVTIGTSPTFFAAMSAHRTARRHGVPFIMEVRDLWPSAFVELGVLRNPYLIALLEAWELHLYRQADRVVTVTSAFRENLIERGIPEGKVINIPNGADQEFWRPTSRPTALAAKLGVEDKFVVLYVGAHGISQALGRILESACLLLDQPRVQFLFVGEGAEKEVLVRRAAAEGLNNVQFLDSVNKDDVRKFYALADVCLVPLRDIPIFNKFIPSKMFEMMAMECPIVASVSGEAAAILNQSGGAVVVPPEDSQAIAGAIRNLADDHLRRAELGRKGRAFLIERYSRRALAGKYLDVIEAVCDEKKVDSR